MELNRQRLALYSVAAIGPPSVPLVGRRLCPVHPCEGHCEDPLAQHCLVPERLKPMESNSPSQFPVALGLSKNPGLECLD